LFPYSKASCNELTEAIAVSPFSWFLIADFEWLSSRLVKLLG